MFVEIMAEMAQAGVVHFGNEIEVFCVAGVGSGFERGFAGQGNGGGCQAGACVRIIRGVALEIGLADAALVGVAHAINDGRIGLQAHADVEAVDENGGHVATVVFMAGFFFDDAGHDE